MSMTSKPFTHEGSASALDPSEACEAGGEPVNCSLNASNAASGSTATATKQELVNRQAREDWPCCPDRKRAQDLGTWVCEGADNTPSSAIQQHSRTLRARSKPGFSDRSERTERSGPYTADIREPQEKFGRPPGTQWIRATTPVLSFLSNKLNSCMTTCWQVIMELKRTLARCTSVTPSFLPSVLSCSVRVSAFSTGDEELTMRCLNEDPSSTCRQRSKQPAEREHRGAREESTMQGRGEGSKEDDTWVLENGSTHNVGDAVLVGVQLEVLRDVGDGHVLSDALHAHAAHRRRVMMFDHAECGLAAGCDGGYQVEHAVEAPLAEVIREYGLALARAGGDGFYPRR